MKSFKIGSPNRRTGTKLPAFELDDDDDGDDGGGDAAAAAAATARSRSTAATASSAPAGPGPPPPNLETPENPGDPGAGAADARAEEHKRRGVAAAEAGDLAAALREFAASAALRPSAAALEMRAQVLLMLGRDFEAVRDAERAARLAPDWPDAWLTLARANLNLGEPRIAVDALRRLEDVAPGHAALASELPEALALAARQRQQQQQLGGGGGGGLRMQVVDPAAAAAAGGGAGGSGAGAGTEAAAAARQQAAVSMHAGGGGAAAGDPDVDPVEAQDMDGVDMTGRVYAPNC